MRVFFALLASLGLVFCGGGALAWGSSGHRLIGRVALESLAADAPPFLKSPEAIEEVGELSREPDRWKDAGHAHDADLDPGHFLNLADDGRIMGGPALADLPPTRSEYERALRRAGADGWKAGYLPYSIIEGWQQLAKDFAYWRAEAAGAKRSPDPAHRRWLAADRERRERLILRDLGVLSHYVGDGSQPLHVSEHFNGWGPFPNPDGYTTAPVHAFFEGEFVRNHVTLAMVRGLMPAARAGRAGVVARTEAYLAATARTVIPFYQLEKAGAFEPADARGAQFAAERLAAGAAELRDLVDFAWRTSERMQVGFPGVAVTDVESGALDPYDSLYGTD